MKKVSYLKLIVFSVAICFLYNVNAQKKKLTQEDYSTFKSIMENPQTSIYEYLSSSDDFSIFLKSLKQSNSISVLESKGQFTVFAPNNMAFTQLPPEVLKQLFLPENSVKLKSITDYHIVDSRIDLNEALPEFNVKIKVKAINNHFIRISKGPEDVFSLFDANGYEMEVLEEIKLSNGIIYVINTVIFPQVDVITSR